MNAWMQNDLKTAEQWLQDASRLEQSVSYSYGPPAVVKPSYELYGEFLLSQNRPKEALSQFEKSLQIAPGRVLALRGKLKAATMLDDTRLMNEIENQIREIIKTPSPQKTAMMIATTF
jgi:hypothetical protein